MRLLWRPTVFVSPTNLAPLPPEVLDFVQSQSFDLHDENSGNFVPPRDIHIFDSGNVKFRSQLVPLVERYIPL